MSHLQIAHLCLQFDHSKLMAINFRVLIIEGLVKLIDQALFVHGLDLVAFSSRLLAELKIWHHLVMLSRRSQHCISVPHCRLSAVEFSEACLDAGLLRSCIFDFDRGQIEIEGRTLRNACAGAAPAPL